jgi:hypothetical protein
MWWVINILFLYMFFSISSLAVKYEIIMQSPVHRLQTIPAEYFYYILMLTITGQNIIIRLSSIAVKTQFKDSTIIVWCSLWHDIIGSKINTSWWKQRIDFKKIMENWCNEEGDREHFLTLYLMEIVRRRYPFIFFKVKIFFHNDSCTTRCIYHLHVK